MRKFKLHTTLYTNLVLLKSPKMLVLVIWVMDLEMVVIFFFILFHFSNILKQLKCVTIRIIKISSIKSVRALYRSTKYVGSMEERLCLTRVGKSGKF